MEAFSAVAQKAVVSRDARRVAGSGDCSRCCALGLVTALAESQLDDPIASSDIEKEIRQMQPDVKLVNCAGADTKDRWTCTLITSACRTAAVVPKLCAPVEAETRLQADAQSSNGMIWVRLINRSLERAGQPESDKDRRSSPGWLRSLRKEAAMEDHKKEGYF